MVTKMSSKTSTLSLRPHIPIIDSLPPSVHENQEPTQEPSLDGTECPQLKDESPSMAVARKDEEKEDEDRASNEADSDTEPDVVAHETTQTERRRLQKARFDTWFDSRAEKIVTETPEDLQDIIDDDARSTKYIMSKQDAGKIITDPREYQLELFERAKHKNTIAVLDTGSGKTLIAVLLLRHVLDDELERRANGEEPRIAFFLVDCVTLVFQQYGVLECNLDQPIDRFCGDMGCDLWDKSTWEAQLAKNKVIVCTAEVLYQCLMHSFVRMSSINLLIFDEAHHAKKDHCYARIIRDFYVSEEISRRPRIFGMTASPVDAKVDVVKAARELETLLHSEIATASDLTLLQSISHRPEEIIGAYGPLPSPFRTPLYAKLHAAFSKLDVLERAFKSSLQASADLGPWCADQVWHYTLQVEASQRLESKIQQKFHALSNHTIAPDLMDANILALRNATEMLREHTFTEPTWTLNDVSPKVLLLHQYLSQRFADNDDDKCIIFVRERATARLLTDLLQRIGPKNLRAVSLMGTRSGEAGDVKFSFRQQCITMLKFRNGTFNCMVATSIAEEGLDIPDCNIVIRFDMYATLIQYIQSRGRARRANSTYIHMLEKGNRAHHLLFADVRTNEVKLRRFCQSLPADRLLKGNDFDYATSLTKDRERRIYVEEATGAKLTYASSLTVLAHYVSTLDHPLDEQLKPMYIMNYREHGYMCEVRLPEIAAILYAIGRSEKRKSLAKQAAAFEACMLLRKKGVLNEHLLPKTRPKGPAGRNALLALHLNKHHSYEAKTKPAIWANHVGTVPDKLFITVLELTNSSQLKRQYRPLALLTRTPLPYLPEFLVHLDTEDQTTLKVSSFNTVLKVNTEKLTMINEFTLRIFYDIYHKRFKDDVKQMPYLIAPLGSNLEISPIEDLLERFIDWQTLSLVSENKFLEWDSASPASFFANKFMLDPLTGKYRYFTEGVESHLKVSDPVPLHITAKQKTKNIFLFTTSLWKQSKVEADRMKQEDQPVIRARKAIQRQNWLCPMTEKEKAELTECYICPEPLRISAIPTDIVAMGYVFGGIMSRIEAYLIALELCEKLELDIKPAYALEALTKDAQNTDQHGEEKINFQSGMGENYEREELLGDCFLKMATSIALFTQNPDKDEFEYHVKRMLLICNKNLLSTACDNKFYEYIQTKAYDRRAWYPHEPELLEGRAVDLKHRRKQLLGDKTIADACEAIIGAALLSHHESRNYDQAVKAVTAMVNSPDHLMQKWDDYYKQYQKPPYQTAPPTRAQIDLAEQISRIDAYKFQSPRLLRSAFLHPSYPYTWEKIPSYQRLEFLGDSLLDMTCVNFLFHRFTDKDPQWLTEHKMAMVSNRFLGAVCVKLNFYRYLRFNSSLIEVQVREYVQEMREAEEQAGEARDYWLAVKSPPKCLPDVVEAYVGALFVDSEFDYGQVERFFDAHIRWFFEDITIYDTYANNHPTTHLHNLLSITLGCQNYRIFTREIPGDIDKGEGVQVIAAVMIHEEIVAEGRGQSGRYAKLRASERALKALQDGEDGKKAFRQRWGCDCLAAGEERLEGSLEDKGAEASR